MKETLRAQLGYLAADLAQCERAAKRGGEPELAYFLGVARLAVEQRLTNKRATKA